MLPIEQQTAIIDRQTSAPCLVHKTDQSVFTKSEFERAKIKRDKPPKKKFTTVKRLTF